MASKTLDQIRTEILQIKNETIAKANSATRVGGVMGDIIDHVEGYIDEKADAQLAQQATAFTTAEAQRDALVDAKVGDITELQNKTSNTEYEATESDVDVLSFESNNGDVVAQVKNDGIYADNYKKLDGTDAIPSIDNSIPVTPSDSKVPSTKLMKDYTDRHGIESDTIEEETEEIIISKNNNDEILKVSEDGVFIEGNNMSDLSFDINTLGGNSKTVEDVSLTIWENNRFIRKVGTPSGTSNGSKIYNKIHLNAGDCIKVQGYGYNDNVSLLSLISLAGYKKNIFSPTTENLESVSYLAESECDVIISVFKGDAVAKIYRASDFVKRFFAKKYNENTPFINNDKPSSPLIYKADTAKTSGFICNAIVHNGKLIACRSNGNIVEIDEEGNENTLLSISGASEWRLMYKDKDGNIYVSPHSSTATKDSAVGSIPNTSRGLYRLENGSNSFVRVIDLFGENNNNRQGDIIWTMCQDADGYLYAGTYGYVQDGLQNASVIWRSNDGVNWTKIFSFNETLPEGKHIHSIIYNQYDNSLYCVVGEINKIWKSNDKGVSWSDIGVELEENKATCLIATPTGIITGSDGSWSLVMSKIYNNGDVRTTSRIWANIVFAIRKSDLTGYLYAMTRNDSSVWDEGKYPQCDVASESGISQWMDGKSNLTSWKLYHDYTKEIYPNDCVRPSHCAILRSKDEGESWEVIHIEEIDNLCEDGFLTAGEFSQGQCVVGFAKKTNNERIYTYPIVISEGTHTIVDGGVDVSNDIYARTMSVTII